MQIVNVQMINQIWSETNDFGETQEYILEDS